MSSQSNINGYRNKNYNKNNNRRLYDIEGEGNGNAIIKFGNNK